MKTNRYSFGLVLLCCISFSCASITKQRSSLSRDMVPDEKTAIAIAKAIWLPIFGVKIYDETPFKAYLIDGKIWLVNGTLKTDIGGVVSIKIRKSDSKVIELFHGK